METDPRYWNCKCETGYIHKKREKTHCNKCQANANEQPDSRRIEVLEDVIKEAYLRYRVLPPSFKLYNEHSGLFRTIAKAIEGEENESK